jgi:uncharacterized protein YecT (DUF1311 family)
MARTTAFASALALAFAGHAYGQTDAQVAARLTQTVHACESAPVNSGTLGQAICYKDEAARQDKRLNETWAQVIGRLPPDRLEALRRDERKWIKDRDDNCRDEAAAYVNSTAAYMFNVCMTDETIRRTIWLEAQTALSAPVTPPTAGTPSGALRAFLRTYLHEAGIAADDASKTRYTVAWKDLNGDGRPEAIVYLEGGAWCGSGGCTLLVLERSGGGFTVRGRTTITRTPIGILPSTTHGWNDLVVGIGGGGVQPGQIVLPFRGDRYAGNPMVPPARRLGLHEKAEVLIKAGDRGVASP